MVEIAVEALDILSTATKEMEQSRAKGGWTDGSGRWAEEARQIDKLTHEEVAMASVQLMKVTHNIDNNVSGIDDDVRGVDVKVQVVNDQLQSGNQLRDSLRKWQSPPDPSTNHNIAGDRQHEGTAEWFPESNQFESWKVTGSLLWIHGKPGSGKSVLCNFRDIDKQARRNLPPSLIIQHSTRSNAFCDILSRLYETHDNDALDECPGTSNVPSAREQVLDLVNDLVGLRPSNLHICVTSRPEADICDALESLASQTVSLQDEDGQKKDITSYVRSVVYSGSGKFMKRWKGEDKEHVTETLSERADGMNIVQRVLRELPKSLETYERMLREIGKVDPEQTTISHCCYSATSCR
ncbi:hypothetical protein EDB84DRAFT_1675873 [Lactarius hengduanensis]|nr:hypothetical protein EDB84DRAFT_1675873 [Lactarius hengduanensis]